MDQMTSPALEKCQATMPTSLPPAPSTCCAWAPQGPGGCCSPAHRAQSSSIEPLCVTMHTLFTVKTVTNITKTMRRLG